MKNNFCFEKTSKIENLDANLKLGHYKFDLSSRLMEIRSITPKITQKQRAKL